MEKIEFKEFYTDEDNPLILKMKNFFRWIIFNVPDCGMVTGFPRLIINFAIIFMTAYVFSMLLLGKSNIFEFLLGSIIAGFMGSIFFMKTFALGMFKALEQYQKGMALIEQKKPLNRS